MDVHVEESVFYVYVLSDAVTLGYSQSELVHSLAVLLSNYCSYFGHTFTHAMVYATCTLCLLCEILCITRRAGICVPSLLAFVM